MLLLALCSWEVAGAPWPVSLLGAFYRAGSFAFGGDAALSPLLLAEAVPRAGSAAALLRARATAQILPGPAAGMAAHLGGASAGPAGALVGWLGLTLPGVLLVHAALPFWATLLGSARAQAVLRGVRAAAAGLLIATTLLLLEAVRSPPERAIALLVLAALNIDPARLPSRLGERFVPPLAMIAGALLGVPLCLHVAGE